MGIQPPSDLILDVVKAADPQRSQAMADRLKQAGTGGGAEAGFDDALSEVHRLPSGISSITASSSLALRNATALSEGKAGRLAPNDPYRRFEAMVLSGFVSSMMPQRADTVFGTGTAGQVWRSMLAERIATEVAKAGGIGIADRVSAGERIRSAHEVVGKSAAKGVQS